MREHKADKFFFIVLFLLVFLGVAMFISASLGILVKSKTTFYAVLFNQLVLGLGLGLLGMWLTYKIPYKFWRRYAVLFFLGAILLTAAVFIPGIGMKHQGAERWLSLGPI